MRSVRDIPVLEKIPVLVRASLNVPIAGGAVTNDFRLRRALPTIEFLVQNHARVILIGHSGDKGTETLRPVYEALKKYLPTLSFCSVTTGEEVRGALRALSPGHVLMLENLRRNKGEVENEVSFAKELAALADVFVQDSFDVCHREHSSVVTLPTLLPSYAGFSVLDEVVALTKALHPKGPSLAIVGGAKFSTKQPVIEKLLKTYDHVFVGGALANDFLQQKGIPMQASSVSSGNIPLLKRLLSNPKLLLPIDALSASVGSDRALAHVGWPKEKEAVYDAGPATITLLESYIENARTVLWNGPLGFYENHFTDGTVGVANALLKHQTARTWYGRDVKKETILGGGDTVDVIEEMQAQSAFSFISTGGGAMLDFLAKGTLPGLRVLDH